MFRWWNIRLPHQKWKQHEFHDLQIRDNDNGANFCIWWSGKNFKLLEHWIRQTFKGSYYSPPFCVGIYMHGWTQFCSILPLNAVEIKILTTMAEKHYEFIYWYPSFFSMDAMQTMIDLQDFLDAEPDVLAHSAPAIIDRFSEYGVQGSIALKALCRKKKGLIVEVGSLLNDANQYMDMNKFSGTLTWMIARNWMHGFLCVNVSYSFMCVLLRL